MSWRSRPTATLDDVVEALHGIGTILMEISAKLEDLIRYTRETTMKKLTPEEYRRIVERGEAARRQMQEILDRVEARRQARLAEYERRGFLRRLVS